MFSASVKSKEILNGVLTVIVTFTNGEQTFNEEFRTSNASDEQWIVNLASRRVQQLNDLYALAQSMKIGDIDLPPT